MRFEGASPQGVKFEFFPLDMSLKGELAMGFPWEYCDDWLLGGLMVLDLGIFISLIGLNKVLTGWSEVLLWISRVVG